MEQVRNGSTMQNHASLTFNEVASHGEACRPLDFPPPVVARGVCVDTVGVDPATGSHHVCSNVIHREDVLGADCAYWPRRRLQDAIYGSVWACLILQRHYGPAADDAAIAAGVEPGSTNAPIVWEITSHFVAIKVVEWARVNKMRGRSLEDPVKEVAAMQLLGEMKSSPHVLSSMEVLQDEKCLYSIMPYCSGGDLFGVVVQHADERGGGGMSEPAARYWFRQILLVRLSIEMLCFRVD